MSFDVQKMLQSKDALRRKLAQRPVSEKLRMVEELSERALATRKDTSASLPDAPWTIPEHWHWAKMGDVATVAGGGTPPTDRTEYFGGDVPWITPADLSKYNQKTISRGARNITQAGLANSGARVLPTGTVLFSSRAPIGYVAIAANPVATNQGFKSFILRDELLPDFVYYYLQRAKELVVGLASGTTFLEISGKKAAKIPIPIPPLDEQRRIVAEIEKQFTRLETGVATLQSMRAKLRRYKAAVLQAALDGHNWPRIRLAKLVEEGAKVLYGILQPGPEVTDGVPYVRPTEIVRDKVQLGSIRRTSKTIAARYARSILKTGDIILSIVGTIGKVATVPSELNGGNITQSSVRIRADNKKVNGSYLAWVLRSPYATRQYDSARLGTAVPRLNVADVRDLLIPLPPLAKQSRIVAEVERKLSVVDELEMIVSANLQRATRLRQSILQKAFSGELATSEIN